jgi:hypothetical protein
MAEELETIDAVARRLNRDVYYLALIDDDGAFGDIYTDVSEATEWLDAQQIGWSLCSGFDEDAVWIEGGPGCIFLDIHPGLEPEAMQLVQARFMDSEGKPSIPSYVPTVLLVEDARKFSQRDDPDYWENF